MERKKFKALYEAHSKFGGFRSFAKGGNIIYHGSREKSETIMNDGIHLSDDPKSLSPGAAFFSTDKFSALSYGKVVCFVVPDDFSILKEGTVEYQGYIEQHGYLALQCKDTLRSAGYDGIQRPEQDYVGIAVYDEIALSKLNVSRHGSADMIYVSEAIKSAQEKRERENERGF